MLIPGMSGNIDWNYNDNQLQLNWLTSKSLTKDQKKNKYIWIETEVVCSDVMELVQM